MTRRWDTNEQGRLLRFDKRNFNASADPLVEFYDWIRKNFMNNECYGRAGVATMNEINGGIKESECIIGG